jgi:outer membrane receptor protein involved in Fe transport
MDKKRFNQKPLSAAIMSVAILGLANTQTAVAQASNLQLEEVIVTAQKRVENLQDVPVSVTAVSGDTLYEAGIQRMEGLQSYVPNLTMTETGIGTNIYIRGIGSGINQGFEQSVGMYVDGIYHGRAQLSRAPFFRFRTG